MGPVVPFENRPQTDSRGEIEAVEDIVTALRDIAAALRTLVDCAPPDRCSCCASTKSRNY